MVVRVEHVPFEFGVAGDVNLSDTFGGNVVDIVERVESVIRDET